MNTHWLQIVSDFVCPWCFIGKRRLDRALEKSALRGKLELEWLPYELDPAMPAGGHERLSYRARRFGSVAKSKEKDEMAREAARTVDLELRYDLMTRTPSTFGAHRLTRWAHEAGAHQGEVVDAIYRAYFLEGRDIGETETLVEIATKAGLEESRTREVLGDAGRASSVREIERGVAAQGVLSVPSYILDQGPVVRGLDALLAKL